MNRLLFQMLLLSKPWVDDNIIVFVHGNDGFQLEMFIR